MSTFDRVKKIVVDQLGVNEADVQIDSTFIDDLELTLWTLLN